MASFCQRLVLPILATFVGCAAILPAGCSNAPNGSPVIDEAHAAALLVPKSMRVYSSFGGCHGVMQIVDNVWYQAYANRLLLLDAESGTMITDLELAPRGTTGTLSDFVLVGTRLYAVLESDAVVEIDVEAPRTPKFVTRWGRPELGIAPRWISRVGDDVMVSGDGGIIRLADAPMEGTTFDEKGKPAPPVPPPALLVGMDPGRAVAAEGGAVACVGRRILRIADGSYLGAASMLIPLPEQAGAGYGFVLQQTEGAQVGLMGTDFRERSSSALRGMVRSIHVFDDRFFAINDFEAATWKLETKPGPDTVVSATAGDGLVLGTLVSVPVRGARDCAKLRKNRFAVAGSFGRALYRYLPEGDKPGDTFYWTERMPGRLDVATTDRRRVLAASNEGVWMYLIGEKAELVDREIASPDRPDFAVEVTWGSATADEKREEVVFHIGDRSETYRPSRGGRVSALAAADGKVWIGHDHGIDVIGYDAAAKVLIAEDRIRLRGPMTAIYQNRVGGGVTYVARYDGFGVIRPIPIDAPPISAAGTVRGFDVPDAPVAAVPGAAASGAATNDKSKKK